MKKKICSPCSENRPPNCKRPCVYLYHVSTWVSHWRWKITLQLNTTHNRRTVLKKLVEMICPSFLQYVKYAAASLLPIHMQLPFWRIDATHTSCCGFSSGIFPLCQWHFVEKFWTAFSKKAKTCLCAEIHISYFHWKQSHYSCTKQSSCTIFPKCGPKKEKLGRLLIQPTCMNTYFVLPG